MLDKNIFDDIYLFVQDTDSDADTVILELPSSSVSPTACDIPGLKRTDSVFVSFSHSCVCVCVCADHFVLSLYLVYSISCIVLLRLFVNCLNCYHGCKH